MDILLEISENDFSTGLSRVCTSFFSVRFEVRLCRAKKISRGRGDRSIRSLGSDDGAENRIHPLSRRRRRESSRRDSRPGSPKVASSLPRTHTQLSLSLSLRLPPRLGQGGPPPQTHRWRLHPQADEKASAEITEPDHCVLQRLSLVHARAPTHTPTHSSPCSPRSVSRRAGALPPLPTSTAPRLGSARLGSVVSQRPRPPPIHRTPSSAHSSPPHPLFPKTSPSQKVIKADSPCPSRQSPG